MKLTNRGKFVLIVTALIFVYFVGLADSLWWTANPLPVK